MSSPIVVRALEAELRRMAGLCVVALAKCPYPEFGNSTARDHIDRARAILDKAARDYDAVSAELQAARAAVELSGDICMIDTSGTTGSGGVSSAPVGRCAP